MKDLKDLMTAQKGSVLEFVNEIFKKGQFICPINEPVQEGEVVIGECTDYERAIKIACDMIADKHNAKARSGQEADSSADRHQKHVSHATCEALEKLFWTSIGHRIGEKATEPDGLRLRGDWKIVSFNKGNHPFNMHLMDLMMMSILGERE